MKKKVLICDRFSLEALVGLKKNSNLDVVLAEAPEHLALQLPTAHGLIIRSKLKINKTLLDQAPHLEVIVTCTSGYDHIDLEETKKRNIAVMFTPEANQISAAELTWGLLLSVSRHIHAADKSIKAGKWQREPFLGFELSGKTLGIVGLGRIGSRVAKMGRAFGMKILAFDPYQDDPAYNEVDAQRVSFEEILKLSDVLSFHVPATKETKNMLNRYSFEATQPELIVINTSRGSVIVEEDLIEALNEGKIRAAGLDVFEKEPLTKESKLLKCPNVVLTSHLGAFTEDAFLKASLQGARQIENFFTSNSLENSLPLVNLWGSLSFQEGI